jgi:hypothetical protein
MWEKYRPRVFFSTSKQLLNWKKVGGVEYKSKFEKTTCKIALQRTAAGKCSMESHFPRRALHKKLLAGPHLSASKTRPSISFSHFELIPPFCYGAVVGHLLSWLDQFHSAVGINRSAIGYQQSQLLNKILNCLSRFLFSSTFFN